MSHTATLLPDGKVLVVGGDSGGAHTQALASAELYDPEANTWTPAAPLHSARLRPTATLLPNGKVLVVGGDGPVDPATSAELYDPTADRWMPAGAPSAFREEHTATLLPNGKVLATGGFGTASRMGPETTSSVLYTSPP
jgi:hypothetical protein